MWQQQAGSEWIPVCTPVILKGDQQHRRGPGPELLEWTDDAGLEFSEGKDTSLGEEVTLFIAPKGSGGIVSVDS